MKNENNINDVNVTIVSIGWSKEEEKTMKPFTEQTFISDLNMLHRTDFELSILVTFGDLWSNRFIPHVSFSFQDKEIVFTSEFAHIDTFQLTEISEYFISQTFNRLVISVQK